MQQCAQRRRRNKGMEKKPGSITKNTLYFDPRTSLYSFSNVTSSVHRTLVYTQFSNVQTGHRNSKLPQVI